MHEENFKRIQIETQKIIKETQGVVGKLIAKEQESSQENEETKTLSIKNLNKHKEILIAEAQKLKSLEYVVAVVGTMKAGKSMTINAIVGQEVLPSREYPMTTLPTLITHVPKQTEPKLTIEKIEPFIKLRDEIKAKITTTNINANDDMKDLVSRIEEGKIKFETKYNGQDEISNFLKDINDLMRIAKEFDIEPPYEEYTNVDDLPRIEVEFYHLSKYTLEASEARLTLLDTPGPDEFKQSNILKNIFKEQLRKASAVTLVVDYTKMNSESDAEVKEQIEDVAEMIGKKHLFVLLNKFDQRGRDREESVQKEEARRLISDGVLKGKIDEKNVYPVASKNAFYANLGLCELAKNQKIDENLSWRESFAVTILGEDWEDDIDDIKRIEKKCNRYWEKSYLEDPLNNIIATIHADALVLALDAPLGKLGNILKEVSTGMRVKENALVQNMEDLKENIEKLQEDIKNISDISNGIEKETDESLALIKKEMDVITETQLDIARNTILNLLNNKLHEMEKDVEEKIQKETEQKKKNEEHDDSFVMLIINGLGKRGDTSNHDELKAIQEMMEKGEVKLKDKDTAIKIMNNIEYTLDESMKLTLENSDKKLKEKIEEFIPVINNKIKDKLGNLIEVIQKRIGGDIYITIPEIVFVDDVISGKGTFANSIQTKIEEKSYSTVSNGFTNWFNDDWGRQTVYYDETTHIITKKDIEKRIKFKFEEVSKNIQENTDSIYAEDIQMVISNSIKNLTLEIEEYRGEMIEVIKKREANTVDIEKEISLAQEQVREIKKLNQRVLDTKQVLAKGKNQ